MAGCSISYPAEPCQRILRLSKRKLSIDSCLSVKELWLGWLVVFLCVLPAKMRSEVKLISVLFSHLVVKTALISLIAQSEQFQSIHLLVDGGRVNLGR